MAGCCRFPAARVKPCPTRPKTCCPRRMDRQDGQCFRRPTEFNGCHVQNNIILICKCLGRKPATLAKHQAHDPNPRRADPWLAATGRAGRCGSCGYPQICVCKCSLEGKQQMLLRGLCSVLRRTVHFSYGPLRRHCRWMLATGCWPGSPRPRPSCFEFELGHHRILSGNQHDTTDLPRLEPAHPALGPKRKMLRNSFVLLLLAAGLRAIKAAPIGDWTVANKRAKNLQGVVGF